MGMYHPPLVPTWFNKSKAKKDFKRHAQLQERLERLRKAYLKARSDHDQLETRLRYIEHAKEIFNDHIIAMDTLGSFGHIIWELDRHTSNQRRASVEVPPDTCVFTLTLHQNNGGFWHPVAQYKGLGKEASYLWAKLWVTEGNSPDKEAKELRDAVSGEKREP